MLLQRAGASALSLGGSRPAEVTMGHQSPAVRKDQKTQRMRAVQVKAFARFGQLELDRN